MNAPTREASRQDDFRVVGAGYAGPVAPAPPVEPFTILDGKYECDDFSQAFVRTTGDARIQKIELRRVTGWGIGSMQHYSPEGVAAVEDTGITTIEDCRSFDVFAKCPEAMASGPGAGALCPGALGGRGEANFWIGNRTIARRLYAARSGWMGMFTGSKCHNSVIEDFELEQFAVGLYIEHVTHDTVFRRFKIHNIADQKVAGGKEPDSILQARSISVEWWYKGEGSYNLTFEDGDIFCPGSADVQAGSKDVRAGVYVDAGTYGVVFRRCRFWGPGRAIVLPKNRVDGGPDKVVEDCRFEQSGPAFTYHDNGIG